MINISNSTSKDNPPWRLAEPIGLTRPARPARPGAPGWPATGRAGPARSGRIPAIAGRGLISASRAVLGWLAAVACRLGDRLFAMNDAEAYWRGWQITKTQGGLGRRYRDPRFDTLAGCPACRGAGVTAALSCLPCLGTGRVTRGEAS